MNDLTADLRVASVRLVKLATNGFDKRMYPKSGVWLAEVDRGLDQIYRATDAKEAKRQARRAFPNALIVG